MSTAETILSALKSALDAASLGCPVERSRVVALDRGDLPFVVVRPKAESSSPIGAGLLHCVLLVEILVETRGDVPDQIADPIATGVDAAIRADSTLGGLVGKTFRTSKDWQLTDSDGTGGQLTISYQIHYTEPA